MGWNLDATVNAAVPGFSLLDQLHSAVDTGLCSQEFERNLTHGGKRTDDKTSFDQKAGSATRTTVFPAGGGSTDFNIPTCARDAVAFAYYARVELGQGRVPTPPASVLRVGVLGDASSTRARKISLQAGSP